MSSASGRYARGNWVLLCKHDAWLIADAPEPTDREVWAVFDDAHGAADVLAGLAGLNVSHFALLFVGGGDTKVAVRGNAFAHWETGDGRRVRVVAPEGIDKWVEIPLSEIPTKVVLSHSGGLGDTGWLPIVSGITHASSVEITWEVVGASSRLNGPVDSVPSAAPAEPLVELHDPATDEKRYDFLFEATSRPVPSPPAAPALVESSDAAMSIAEQSAETLRGEPPVLTSQPVEVEDEQPRLIVSVPGFEAPSTSERTTVPVTPFPTPSSQETRRPEVETSDVDDRTVLRAALPSPHGTPLVKAVPCPNGHPNPPHASTCRICREAIVAINPTTVPRPQLGRLLSPTGVTIPLDRGAIIGRNPDSTWDEDSERPHVVRLASPGKEISRNHVRIKLDGWHVLVTDLGSTNGTFVTLPGQEPQRLRDDPVAIVPGTIVNVADEVSFEYEAGA